MSDGGSNPKWMMEPALLNPAGWTQLGWTGRGRFQVRANPARPLAAH